MGDGIVELKMDLTLIALGVLILLTVVSLLIREKSEFLKWILFCLIALTIVFNTSYLIWSTLLVNQQSVTKGPVHWHADFEIWNCGEKVDIIDPKGLENKVGTSVFHEHNDNRIHIEGPVSSYHQISLGGFFKTIGGELTASSLKIPTHDGVIQMSMGNTCNGRAVKLQVFVYKVMGNKFYQEKLEDPQSYVISPHSQVPPGDCLIIEFDKVKEKTDRLCNFYRVAKEKGELDGD